MANTPQRQSSFHEGGGGSSMISNAFVPSPGLTREESIRQSSLPGEGPTNQHHSTGFFDGSNFWGAAYSGDSKDRCCCLQACVCPRGSTESSDGGCGWRRSWNHFVEMARVTWSCKDARHELDKESLERMKSTYWLSRVVYLRALGFIYFVAFLVAFNQSQGLIGSDGILPASEYATGIKKSFVAGESLWERMKEFPSLFLFLSPNDFWIHCIPFVGCVVSFVLLIQGAGNGFLLLFMWVLYQTVRSVGQAWYSFGWESQLLELGFLSIWLCPFWSCTRFPPSWPTPKICVWGNRWLLFRLMLGAGLIKLRGDEAWRNLTALDYHFETMPIPSPLSWYFHNQSHAAHAFQTVANHIVECALSFLIILPFRQCRIVGGLIQMLFQVAIIVSGNFSFLNHLSIIPALFCLDDHFLTCLFPSKTLDRLPPLVKAGSAGAWSMPLVQAWPLAGKTPPLIEQEKLGSSEGPDAGRRDNAEHARLLANAEAGGGLDAEQHPGVPDEDPPRTCCCWYRPHAVRFIRSLSLSPQLRQRVSTEIRENWGKLGLEILAATGIMTFMGFVANPATTGVWMVIAVFFLAIYLAASSAFFTRALVSHVFVEVVLLVVTVWSFIAVYKHGPAVWSVWLTLCLFTILIAFAYTTLTNAALIFKVHVELLLTLLIISLSIPVVYNLISPNQIMNASLDNPLELLNTYGAFGSVTKERYELIIQGTDDPTPDERSVWKTYEFKCKPGNVNRRPCLITPYHYRLDWLMWFVPMNDASAADFYHPWFYRFLTRLLKNTKSVTNLLAINPFENQDPPTAIRVLRMLYKFTKQPYIGRGPWWEVVPEKTTVFVSPADIPGADRHLENVLLMKLDREKRKKEAEERKRREEEEAKEKLQAREEDEREKKEKEKEEEREKKEEAEKEAREKKEDEEEAAIQKEEEERERIEEEKQKKREEREDQERREEEKEVEEEEAKRKKEKQELEEKKKTEEEEKRRVEAEEARKKADAEAKRRAKELARMAVLQAREEERDRLREQARKEEEAEQAKLAKAHDQEEAARRKQQAEEDRRRRKKLEEEEEEKRRKELEEERRRRLVMMAPAPSPAPMDTSGWGQGVPLKAASRFTQQRTRKPYGGAFPPHARY